MSNTLKYLKVIIAVVTAVSVLGLPYTALSHTPYLAPNAFEPINGGLVTLDASFAEHFFIPEIVFDGSAFEVYLPDGSIRKPDLVQPIKSRVVVEHELEEDGTYRFSTGRRSGRVFLMYELDGDSYSLEDPSEPVPEGAEITQHYQSYTMAETYVTRGGPSDTALAPRNDGLELSALSNPNDLFVDESLQLQALFYGKPLADLNIDVFLATRGSADDVPAQTLKSGPEGGVSFTPTQGGVYLLRARHRAQAPAGSKAPEISHTYTLVIEAVE